MSQKTRAARASVQAFIREFPEVSKSAGLQRMFDALDEAERGEMRMSRLMQLASACCIELRSLAGKHVGYIGEAIDARYIGQQIEELSREEIDDRHGRRGDEGRTREEGADGDQVSVAIFGPSPLPAQSTTEIVRKDSGEILWIRHYLGTYRRAEIGGKFAHGVTTYQIFDTRFARGKLEGALVEYRVRPVSAQAPW